MRGQVRYKRVRHERTRYEVGGKIREGTEWVSMSE